MNQEQVCCFVCMEGPREGEAVDRTRCLCVHATTHVRCFYQQMFHLGPFCRTCHHPFTLEGLDYHHYDHEFRQFCDSQHRVEKHRLKTKYLTVVAYLLNVLVIALLYFVPGITVLYAFYCLVQIFKRPRLWYFYLWLLGLNHLLCYYAGPFLLMRQFDWYRAAVQWVTTGHLG